MPTASVRHLTIGTEATCFLQRRRLQPAQITAAVFFGGKAGLAIVFAALDDALRNSDEFKASKTPARSQTPASEIRYPEIPARTRWQSRGKIMPGPIRFP